MLRKLWYVPLEPYENRYTFQLLEWAKRQFKASNIDYEIVDGISLTSTINIGQVLDAVGRPFYAMSQVQALLQHLQDEHFTDKDFIFFEDMFHPGIESLFYAFNQWKFSNKHENVPKIGMRCLAQTIDPDDFVHYTGMEKWMRHYERMVVDSIDMMFVASKEMLGYIRAAGWKIPITVTGLPFCIEEVIERLGEPVKPWNTRNNRIVFSSRIAKEKNPNFLVDFARVVKAHDDSVEVAILSGSLLNRKDIELYYPRLHEVIQCEIITVYENLSKVDYYKMLNRSRLLFNCSFQDWVSNTGSEADALGCNLLFPAYRSFPEAFRNDADRMYIPWNVMDAAEKASKLLRQPYSQGIFAGRQDATNFKTLQAIKSFME
jgi:hypothetical protein